jgi:hypothetical protein
MTKEEQKLLVGREIDGLAQLVKDIVDGPSEGSEK